MKNSRIDWPFALSVAKRSRRVNGKARDLQVQFRPYFDGLGTNGIDWGFLKFRSFRIAFLVIVLLLVPCPSAIAAPPPGIAHPRLVVTTLNGKTFDLATQRGKWVIVNFWATWCSPCIAEMPAISKYVATHKDVAAIGLAWDESPRADLLKFAHEHPVDYPLAQVHRSHPPAGFPAPAALPTTYLIAPDGTVAKHFLGPIDAQSLDAAMAAATASRRPTSAARETH